MNQIPNIEETHNTREVIEKVILDWIKEEKKDNYAYGDIKTNYTLDGYFNFSNLVDALHQQLQKARQDWLREEIVRLERTKQELDDTMEGGSHLNLLIKSHNEALQTIIDRHQAELEGGLVDKG